MDSAIRRVQVMESNFLLCTDILYSMSVNVRSATCVCACNKVYEHRTIKCIYIFHMFHVVAKCVSHGMNSEKIQNLHDMKPKKKTGSNNRGKNGTQLVSVVLFSFSTFCAFWEWWSNLFFITENFLCGSLQNLLHR